MSTILSACSNPFGFFSHDVVHHNVFVLRGESLCRLENLGFLNHKRHAHFCFVCPEQDLFQQLYD